MTETRRAVLCAVVAGVLLSGMVLPAAAQPEPFYSGGWMTTGEHDTTVLTVPPDDESRIFRVSSVELVDERIARFQFEVDGRWINAVSAEGSAAFVEATRLSIRQNDDGTFHQGRWEVVDPAQQPYAALSWTAYYPPATPTLVAHFEEPRAFVLSIHPVDQGCADAQMSVVLDGRPVLAQTNPPVQRLFAAGSSFIGRARSILVYAQGSCSRSGDPEGKIDGSLKVRLEPALNAVDASTAAPAGSTGEGDADR